MREAEQTQDTLTAEDEIERLRRRDVEREAEMERLRGRLDLLEGIVGKMANLVYVHDSSTDCNVFANRELAQMLGYDEEEIHAMGADLLPSIFHPEDAARIPALRALFATANDGDVVPLEYRLRGADGQYRWMEDRCVVFTRNPDGSVRQTLGTLQDITERKRREADERLANQAVLRAFLDHTPALMFVKDLEGRFLLVNREMERFTGRSREEILGKKADAFLPPQGVRNSEDAERRALAEGRAQHLQIVPRPDGPVYYQSIKFRVEDDEGAVRGIGTVAIDITAEQQHLEERAEHEAQNLARQAALIRELASPLLPIAEHVVAMPLIGSIDEARAGQITEALLLGVSGHGARVAILDVTGLRQVDTHVASALVNAARAVKLLGAEVVVTGMRPAVAQALVETGADLQGITTLATLRAGIAWAMRR
ncbi:PAS domain S-box protein [Polyangium spumosum]|uniref:PAS domain S-box protein n=1 Tax=Polyangium spumosum TaxID=889282 RepID=A0A6N7PTP4_9BACT|nr:PAS domain S-box protein [Polyangium spumosum]MRG95428.1 PAS domain S-box protein [Polyangium spumosum]